MRDEITLKHGVRKMSYVDSNSVGYERICHSKELYYGLPRRVGWRIRDIL